MNLKLLRRLSLSLFAKPTPPLLSPLFLRRCFPFSTTIPNPARISRSFDDVVSGSSAVYCHALKFQRPATFEWCRELENRASFIGTVTRQPKTVNSKTGRFGVFTVLKVSNSRFKDPDSSSFWLVLLMWGKLGEFALKHLEENDFIYVSGCLGSYSKTDPTHVNYKLIVKDLGFVSQECGSKGHKKSESVEAEAGTQKNHNRLYLWQVFFSNPYDWWDCRNRKLNPKQPDFKHKDTGEALWLSKYDPPWLKKQLQLFDSKVAEGGFPGRSSRINTWVYDE